MFENFSNPSRIWIYISDKPFSSNQQLELEPRLKAFCVNWTAHNHQLKAEMKILHNQMIIVAVDETQAGASGCSIDKSVNLMKEIEKDYQVNLFERTRVAFISPKGEIKTALINEIIHLYDIGELNEHTDVFNTLVQTKLELESNFVIPLKESWVKKYLKTTVR